MSAIICLGTNDVIDAQKNNQKNNDNKLVENSNVVEEEKEKNNQALTGENSKIKNVHQKNWFVRIIYKVLNFFRGIGSKIRGCFRRQPEKIDIVSLKNNSVISDINSVKDKDSGAPKVDNLDHEK